MFNHARTLLANQIAANGSPSPYLAEELTPPIFVPLITPDYLQSFRTVLFGYTPDRQMINYRTRQLMTLLHSTPLLDYVLRLDPRTTYRTGSDSSLVGDELFVPSILQISGVPATLYVTGQPEPPDIHGRIRQFFDVVASGAAVLISKITAPAQQDSFPLVLVDGLSALIPLTGTGLTCQFTSVVGSWQIETFNRPQFDLGALTATLAELSETSFRRLFGETSDEPYATCRNLWYRQNEWPLRLGAVILAMIYRLDEVRGPIGG